MKIYLDSIGCRLNQSEIEQFGRQLRSRGYKLTANPEEAELAVVNTCAVTAKASSDSRMKARRLGENIPGGVILTGCWSTLKPESAAAIPNIRGIVENNVKDDLIEMLFPEDPIESERGLLAREPIPGIRSRTRAFIKVQDGCDLQCTFCVTTIARGSGRSVPMEKVIDDIRYAERGGVKEAVLTGVHLGSWGHDIVPELSLRHLIENVLSETDIPRLRLSSLEPWDLDQDFFSLWDNPRLCPHLHLPLQSGSNRILRRMARRTTTEEFAALVEMARSLIPDVAITTDLIVGFPGESQHDFEQSLEFVEKVKFAAGHVFTYSERPGTPAIRLGGQVTHRIRKDRGRQLRAALRRGGFQFSSSQIGTVRPVLWESIRGSGPNGFELSGWTDNYIRVKHVSKHNLSNQISRVKLKEFESGSNSILVDLKDV
jgi:threonylcarbamoyladenosine tRNA methylthiotransferase MtaB